MIVIDKHAAISYSKTLHFIRDSSIRVTGVTNKLT